MQIKKNCSHDCSLGFTVYILETLCSVTFWLLLLWSPHYTFCWLDWCFVCWTWLETWEFTNYKALLFICQCTIWCPMLDQGILGSVQSGKSALVHRYLTGSYMQEESPEGEQWSEYLVPRSSPCIYRCCICQV